VVVSRPRAWFIASVRFRGPVELTEGDDRAGCRLARPDPGRLALPIGNAGKGRRIRGIERRPLRGKEGHQHVVSGSGDGGLRRCAERRQLATGVRLIPSVDRVQRVVYRGMDHREGTGLGHAVLRGRDHGVRCEAIPLQDRVGILRLRGTGRREHERERQLSNIWSAKRAPA
jgi:hypothetical protein